MANGESSSYCIKSVKTALEILEAIGEEGSDVRLTCLSKKVNMQKGRLHRFLTTFMECGYVEQKEKTGRYRLGLSAYAIGQKALSNMSLTQASRPIMEELAMACNEAVYLAVAQDQELLLLDMVNTTQRVAVISLIGNRYPLDNTAAGKIAKACKLPQKGLSAESEPLPDSGALAIEQRGLSVDFDTLGNGITSITVPFFNQQGGIPGFLCLVGPQFRFSEERINHELIPRLQKAGQAVSKNLGYSGH